MDSVIQALSVKRVYPHKRELVFRAWTEPARLEKWFSPNPNNRIKARVDLRVGGSYRIAMIPPDGDGWVVGGVYRVIDTPEKLVFTWAWEDSEEPPSLVSVGFQEVEEGTEVEVIHSELETQASYDSHREGWQGILVRLEAYMSDIMEWLASNATDLLTAATQIQMAKYHAQMAFDRLTRCLGFVPEDRRYWSPSETSKSAQRIAAHMVHSNRRFAAVLRGDPMPYRTAQETANEIYALETELKDWDETLRQLLESAGEALASFDQLDPARLVIDPKVAFVLTLIGRHADGHASQIDYLQTVWGDTQDHF